MIGEGMEKRLNTSASFFDHNKIVYNILFIQARKVCRINLNNHETAYFKWSSKEQFWVLSYS